MSEYVTTGVWRVDPDKQAAFVDAWGTFAKWASTMPGATALRLGRDTNDPGRYVSFAPWASAAAVQDWKATPEFREHLAQVLQYVDDFQNTELDVVAMAGA